MRLARVTREKDSGRRADSVCSPTEPPTAHRADRFEREGSECEGESRPATQFRLSKKALSSSAITRAFTRREEAMTTALEIVTDTAQTSSNGLDVHAWIMAAGVVVALGGFSVTIFTLWRNGRWLRRQGYQRLHEKLIEQPAARGRRTLFVIYHERERQRDKGTQPPPPGHLGPAPLQYPGPRSEEWDDANYAMALYDTLGGYVVNGLVPKKDVLRAWHHPLKAITPVVDEFVQHRRALGIEQPWAFLRDLLEANATYRCDCTSCGRSPS